MEYPVLYSFRRCPYAMRARMALAYADVTVELREIQLRDKPQAMLALSPKGTVPVLALLDGRVLEESLDIMLWAVSQNDPADWWPDHADQRKAMLALIDQTESQFKPALDRYKYPDRYQNVNVAEQWEIVQAFFKELESRLQTHRFLFFDQESLADIAIFPFVRQCAKVDEEQFLKLPYPKLIEWLSHHLESAWLAVAMQSFPVWQPGTSGVSFPAA